jgi:hypothetical protein
MKRLEALLNRLITKILGKKDNSIQYLSGKKK